MWLVVVVGPCVVGCEHCETYKPKVSTLDSVTVLGLHELHVGTGPSAFVAAGSVSGEFLFHGTVQHCLWCSCFHSTLELSSL